MPRIDSLNPTAEMTTGTSLQRTQQTLDLGRAILPPLNTAHPPTLEVAPDTFGCNFQFSCRDDFAVVSGADDLTVMRRPQLIVSTTM
jgi:hypothetical protein